MTGGHFFYHDDTYRQVWLTKKAKGLQLKTKFGSYTKEKYPWGFQSALIFVDHCDFDSVAKVEAIFYGTSNKRSKDYGQKGIVGTGLTATKTVFANAEGTENIGLDNNAYRNLIERLFRDKIEIAPHSLRPKQSLARNSSVLEKDLKIMAQFKPRTWVDHAYLFHNLTRFGWDQESPYYLLDKLLDRDYLFFWSKIDCSLNTPNGNLNLFDPSGWAGKDYLKKVWRLIKEREKLSKIAFVFFWDFIGNLLGWPAKDDLLLTINMIQSFFKKLNGKSDQELFRPKFGPAKRTLGRLINPIFYFQMIRNFFLPDEIDSLTEGFYPLEFDGQKAYFFNSLWINDCVRGYDPANIDRLIASSGFHIGHNYFCADEKHYLNLSFKKEGCYYAIADGFQSNLEYLAQGQKEKKVWVTTVADFGQHFLNWQQVDLELIGRNRLLVKNLGESKIKGLTIAKKFSDGRKPMVKLFPHKNWQFLKRDDKLLVWFDLEAKEKLVIEIK